MWIRRSDLEIKKFEEQQERKRRSLLRPMLWGAVWSISMSVLYYLGYRGGGRRYVIFAQPSTFQTKNVVLGVFVFLVVSAMVYRKQRRGRKFLDDSGLLCSECLNPSSLSGCPCGGKLEPYDYYTWEEDEVRADLPDPAMQN